MRYVICFFIVGRLSGAFLAPSTRSPPFSSALGGPQRRQHIELESLREVAAVMIVMIVMIVMMMMTMMMLTMTKG